MPLDAWHAHYAINLLSEKSFCRYCRCRGSGVRNRMSTLFTTITTRQILIILLFAAGTLTVPAQPPFVTAESFVRECIDDGDTPGLQYVVVSKDSVLVQFSEGFSDLAGTVRMNKRTTMMIYSMTKTITAAAVLQLVDRGIVSLDVPVKRYMDDFPYGDRITVRHLLAQMSGIPNPIPLSWVHLVSDHASFDEQLALHSVVEENPELQFEPGTKYGYSNISYWFLGHLIESVTGTTYEEYVRQHIFQRLNIPREEIDFVIPFREYHAKGYLPKWSFMNLLKSFLVDEQYIGEYEDSWLHINDHYLNGSAFGGIVATAGAVGIFLQDQLRDSSALFSCAMKELFFQQQKNNDGETVEMSPGWHIGEIDGRSFYFKEGGGGGFHVEMRLYRDKGIASVVLANNTTFDVKDFLDTADRYFFNNE